MMNIRHLVSRCAVSASLLLASLVLGLVFRAEPLPGHARAQDA